MATCPAGVVVSAVYEVGPTCRTVVRDGGFATGNVHRAAALHARIRDDGRAVRADVEVVSRQLAQGFELFIQDVLVDDRLAAVAWFHSDALDIS